MSQKTVLIAGASGLVGKAIVKTLKDDPDISAIEIIGRRVLPELQDNTKIRQHIVDLLKPDTYRHFITADYIICSLGTTIKKAGSQEKFRDVDYRMPLLLAENAPQKGKTNFILISAVGADPYSKIFYNKVKGELETDLSKFKFKSLHILHPSLLLGEREEKRGIEKFLQMIMPGFSFLVPYKYRPVYADTLAVKTAQIIKGDYSGIYFYEGKSLYL